MDGFESGLIQTSTVPARRTFVATGLSADFPLYGRHTKTADTFDIGQTGVTEFPGARHDAGIRPGVGVRPGVCPYPRVVGIHARILKNNAIRSPVAGILGT